MGLHRFAMGGDVAAGRVSHGLPRAGAATSENVVGGEEVEGVGSVGEVGGGDADLVVAEERREADQGVGEAVGLTDAVAEKLVLAGARFTGSEGEFEALDGGGELEGFELGLEGREQGFWAGCGLGQLDF